MKEIKIKAYTLEELKNINNKVYEREIESLKSNIIENNFNFYSEKLQELQNIIEHILDVSIIWRNHYSYKYPRIKYDNYYTDNVKSIRAIGKLYKFYVKLKEIKIKFNFVYDLFIEELEKHIFDYEYMLKNKYTFNEIIEKSLFNAYVNLYDGCCKIEEECILEYKNNFEDIFLYSEYGNKIY